jgi:ribosomal protein L37AE/L43A
MNVLQCTPCGSQVWTLTAAGTVVCAKCQRVPASLRLVFVPVEPSAQTVTRTEASPA